MEFKTNMSFFKTEFYTPLRSACIKAACKMYMKLRPGSTSTTFLYFNK